MVKVDIVAEQDLLHLQPTLPGEIPMPDHLPELAITQDLHLLELVHLHQ